MPWQIVNIPGKPPSSPELSTVDVLASSIEPKLANTLVRRLNQLCPLENLCHVKRVRKRSVEGKVELSVILCLCQEPGSHGVGMPNDLFQLASTYKLSPYKAKVARSAALSKEEWEEQCKLWPTSYHPSFNPLDSGFDEEESQKIINYMQLAHKLLITPDNKVVNAAVIVDPLNGKIIASANDQTFSGFPRNETISNCISCSELSIAAFSKPGENSLRNLVCGSESKLLTHDLSSVSCLYPWRWTDHRHDNHSSQTNCQGNISWHPLRHAVLVAIEKAAATDRQLFPCLKFQNDQPLPNMGLHDFSDNTPSKRQKTIISDNLSLEANDVHPECMPPEALRPYLCTGFDIYIGWEPCAMCPAGPALGCRAASGGLASPRGSSRAGWRRRAGSGRVRSGCAMALVHQRIRRIFYAFPNPNAGALGSVYRLQGERSLNHHYSVFRILIPEEDS